MKIEITSRGEKLDFKRGAPEAKYVRMINALFRDLEDANNDSERIAALKNFVTRSEKFDFGKQLFSTIGIKRAFDLFISKDLAPTQFEIVDFLEGIPWPGRGYITMCNSDMVPLRSLLIGKKNVTASSASSETKIHSSQQSPLFRATKSPSTSDSDYDGEDPVIEKVKEFASWIVSLHLADRTKALDCLNENIKPKTGAQLVM